MPLETATWINDLNADNPAGNDPRARGDDHIRLIKKVLKNTFPDQDGVFSSIQALTTLTAAASLTWDVAENPAAQVVLDRNVGTLLTDNNVDGGIYSLLIRQDGAGNRSFAFPNSWLWVGGSAQAISTGANTRTLVTIRQLGTSIYVAPLLKAFS